jgi:hypothetical protein
MAGAKTRFGFMGGSDPPDAEGPQSARTVYGHDIHLQLPPGFVPPRPPGSPTPLSPAPARWTPSAPVRAPMAEQESTNPIPTRAPARPRQSRLARFLGRWTRSGRFESRSRMDLDADEDLELPRDTTGRNVLLVLLVALLAFGLTFAIVKLRQRFAAPALEGPAQTVAPPLAPPVPVPAAPASPAAVPVAPAPTPPAQPPAQAGPTPAAPPAPATPAAAKGLGPLAPAPGPRKPERAGPIVAEPPAHLKGELLPFKP